MAKVITPAHAGSGVVFDVALSNMKIETQSGE